jgi:hypothetical protein
MTLSPNPEGDMIAEAELRAALLPHKVNAAAFEAGTLARIDVAEAERANDPLANAPELFKAAAALLPTPVIAGGNVTASSASLANASGISKLLGFVAMPAISLFVLPAAALFGVATIRGVQRHNIPAIMDQEATRNACADWARRHKWFLYCLFVGTLALAWLGATSLMLLLYLISLIVLLYVLSGFARVGLANRHLIAQSCLMGLLLLSQVSAFSGIGDQDIHFVDQQMVAAVFLGGALVLLPVVATNIAQFAGKQIQKASRWALAAALAVPLVALIGWDLKPILLPATPERIKDYVESFDDAPYSTASWQQWEIVAAWAVDSNLDLDLSRPRRLLSAEIAGEQNPFILGTAFRVGLIRANQVGQLRDYDKRLRTLLDDPNRIMETRPINGLVAEDWVIRASVLHGDLSPGDRDYLEKRLQATLADLAENPYGALENALHVMQLLEVLQRPIDRARFRDEIHDLLRKCHSKKGGGFQVAGGFRQTQNMSVGSVEATAYAVQLMQVYGAPDDLDLNWVRSFLRPRSYGDLTDAKWINAVTLDRLNHMPNVTHPTWLEVAYYERSLIMAVLLVALCFYATFSSPLPGRSKGTGGSASATPLNARMA